MLQQGSLEDIQGIERLRFKNYESNFKIKICKDITSEDSFNHNMIRGSEVLQAMKLVQFLPQKGAKIVSKVLDSAVANAENNFGLDIDDLKVSNAYVDEAPTFKRFRARARGRGTRILKRNSHITIEISDE